MTKVFIPTINHSQSWPPFLHVMDEKPLSCGINTHLSHFVGTHYDVERVHTIVQYVRRTN